ncbi:hypothetical protein JCM3775_002504 [Rhodotorula graminis]
MTDRLTQLPAELFITICELVHASKEGPYLAFISRAFVPVARKLAFREVTVNQYDHLQALCEVIGASEPVAGFIEVLNLDLRGSRPDRGVPRTAILTSTFRRLTNLYKLGVTSSSRLAKFAVSPAPKALPSLTVLEITDPLDGWANPFAPRNLRHLNNYPILDRLNLEVDRDSDSLGRYRPDPEHQPWFGDFEWLGLSGPLSRNPAVPDLLTCFGIVEELSLHDESDSDAATLPALFEEILLRDWVFVLSIRQMALDPAPLVPALRPFKQLEAIEFRRGTWSSAMLPVLQALKSLEHLFFFPNSGVSTDDLRRMISGTTKLERLKYICLNVLWWDDDEDALVGWGRGFNLSGVIGLLAVADAAGVELEGVAVDIAREHLKSCAACRVTMGLVG